MRFLTRYDGEVSEPLVGRQGSRVSMRVAGAGTLKAISIFSFNGSLQHLYINIVSAIVKVG